MEVRENPSFTVDYFDPEKRGIGNAVQVFFKDGSSSERVEVSYPIGHRRRRAEGIPALIEKFRHALTGEYDDRRVREIEAICASQSGLEAMPVPDFVDEWVK